MNNVRQIIAQEAMERGEISFRRFMELALYCPDFGYYEQPEMTPGRKGDFYTSVSVGNLFGRMLGFQFAEWLAGIEEPRRIVEAGAHNGQLAVDVLSWMEAQQPEISRELEYWIVEPSARRKSSQEATLKQSGVTTRVRWHKSWDEVPDGGVRGVIFANELLDAMPVRRIGWDSKTGEWFEWGVAWNGTEFVWKHLPLAPGDGAAPKLPEGLQAVLPDEFTTEICPAAAEWWRTAASKLGPGKLLTFDYGLAAEEYFVPERREGTLRAYHKHHLSGDLLAIPGEQDLTAHVNFTAIQEAGESQGLRTECFEDQSRFLTKVLRTITHGPERFGGWDNSCARQFQTLAHPAHLGQSFRVLVQSRAQ